MKHLRQYIRQILLTEAMKTEIDLPDDIGVEIYDYKKSAAYIGYCEIDKNGNYVRSLSPGLETAEDTIFANNPTALPEEFRHPSGIFGTVGMEPLRDWGDPDCDGAWIITNTVAKPGYGPLLYDVAIEWATLYGSGLVSDRYNVSDAARGVWAKYADHRIDVDKFQCDDTNNTLTPGDSDNLEQEAAILKLPPGSDFTSSPLSKRYSKSPTRINSLKLLGKLFFTN